MLELRPLSSAFGVEVSWSRSRHRSHRTHGPRCARPIARGHLVLVRGECVAMDTQRGFASLFGPVIDARTCPTRGPTASSRTARCCSTATSRSRPHPYLGLSLHALELPPSGSSTYFVDAVAAFRALPSGRCAIVCRACTATHAFDLQTQRGDSPAHREPYPQTRTVRGHPVVLDPSRHR